MLWCKGCRAREAHVKSLEARLAAADAEKGRLVDRICALASPAALQVARAGEQPPRPPMPSFAQDENGTHVMLGGVEVPVVKHGPDGDPHVYFMGRLVPLKEAQVVYDTLESHMNGEAMDLPGEPNA